MREITLGKLFELYVDIFNKFGIHLLNETDEMSNYYVFEETDINIGYCSKRILMKFLGEGLIDEYISDNSSLLLEKFRKLETSMLIRNAESIRNSIEWKKLMDLSNIMFPFLIISDCDTGYQGRDPFEFLDRCIGRSKYMLNKQYYEGYEGEGEIRLWYDEKQDENGMVIWIGFWETILEGCYNPDYQKNGIVECYFNHDGFYDDKWEMKSTDVVLQELNMFNEKGLDTIDKKILDKSKEIIKKLCCFIDMAIKYKRTIYIEYN